MRILLVTELDLDGVGERLGVVRRGVDRDERLGRLEVVRLELEHLLVGLGRAIELLLLVGPELRDLEEERDLRRSARLLRLLLLEDANELVPLAALGVEDLEVVPAAERQVLLLQRVLRAPVVRVEREERAPCVDRALVVVEALAVDRAQLGEDLDLRRGVERGLGLASREPPPACRSPSRARRARPALRAPRRSTRRWRGPLARGRCRPRASSRARSRASRSRGTSRARAAPAACARLRAAEPEELLPVAALLVHLPQVVDRLRRGPDRWRAPPRTPSRPRPGWRTWRRRGRPPSCRARPSRRASGTSAASWRIVLTYSL